MKGRGRGGILPHGEDPSIQEPAEIKPPNQGGARKGFAKHNPELLKKAERKKERRRGNDPSA